MSQKELQRLKVVENAVEGRLSVKEASELLQLSARQVKRLKHRYDPADAAWVHHGNQGRQAANAIPETVRKRVMELALGKYAGFNDSHLREKLAKAEGLGLSRLSVQRILRQAGIRSPQKRRPQEGMLLQIDGSCHDWLEGRGPQLTLLGAVDDATNTVCAAHFQSEPVSRYLDALGAQSPAPLFLEVHCQCCRCSVAGPRSRRA